MIKVRNLVRNYGLSHRRMDCLTEECKYMDLLYTSEKRHLKARYKSEKSYYGENMNMELGEGKQWIKTFCVT